MLGLQIPVRERSDLEVERMIEGDSNLHGCFAD